LIGGQQRFLIDPFEKAGLRESGAPFFAARIIDKKSDLW
jgi:hypothetical protein